MTQSIVIMESPAMPEAWWGYIIAVAVLAGPISGGLAWAAKLRWSKEFAAAKDETIKSKDAQIAFLQAQIISLTNNHNELVKAKEAHLAVVEREVQGFRDLTPMKIKEYLQASTGLLESYNDMLKQQIEEARNEIGRKNSAIQELKCQGQSHLMAFTQLTQEKENLESQMVDLKKQGSLSREEILSQLATGHGDSTVLAFIASYVLQTLGLRPPSGVKSSCGGTTKTRGDSMAGRGEAL